MLFLFFNRKHGALEINFPLQGIRPLESKAGAVLGWHGNTIHWFPSRISLPHMPALYASLICLPYMPPLYVCRICLPYIPPLYACTCRICLHYMPALYVSHINIYNVIMMVCVSRHPLQSLPNMSYMPPYMSAVYPCLICLSYIPVLYPCLICLPHMSVLYCHTLISMPLISLPYMSALYVCLIHVLPSMSALSIQIQLN